RRPSRGSARPSRRRVGVAHAPLSRGLRAAVRRRHAPPPFDGSRSLRHRVGPPSRRRRRAPRPGRGPKSRVKRRATAFVLAVAGAVAAAGAARAEEPPKEALSVEQAVDAALIASPELLDVVDRARG